MTNSETFTRYKEQKDIFEEQLNKQLQLLEDCTNNTSFKGQKEYQKALAKLQKEFKKLLRSFTNVREKTISLEKYTKELKDIRKYTTTVEGFIKISNTVYMRTTKPKQSEDILEYFAGIDSDVSYICKFIKRNNQVFGKEDSEVNELISKLLRNKQETGRDIIRGTMKKPKVTLDLDNCSGGELLHQLRSEEITLKHLLKETKDYETIKAYEERLFLVQEQIKLARKHLAKEKMEERGMRK